MLALAAMTLFVVSCKTGTPGTSDSDSNATKNENVEKEANVDPAILAQYTKFTSDVEKAIDDGDLEKAQSIMKDVEEWWEALPEDEQDALDAYEEANKDRYRKIENAFRELQEATEQPIEEE